MIPHYIENFIKLVLFHLSPTFPLHTCYCEYYILYRLPEDEDNLLHAAYTILYTVPRAIENYIDREYRLRWFSPSYP